jgi:hypothetical protein
MQGVTERRGKPMGTNFTYQNKKERQYQHVSVNIQFVSESRNNNGNNSFGGRFGIGLPFGAHDQILSLSFP